MYACALNIIIIRVSQPKHQLELEVGCFSKQINSQNYNDNWFERCIKLNKSNGISNHWLYLSANDASISSFIPWETKW